MLKELEFEEIQTFFEETFKEDSGNKSYPLHLMSEPIYYEIAFRHYKYSK